MKIRKTLIASVMAGAVALTPTVANAQTTEDTQVVQQETTQTKDDSSSLSSGSSSSSSNEDGGSSDPKEIQSWVAVISGVIGIFTALIGLVSSLGKLQA